jgi:hypothetical protein
MIIGSRSRFSNPFLTNWQAYQAALRPEDLPSQAQAMLQRMRQDYQQLLAPKLHAQVEETVTIALRAREAAEETPMRRWWRKRARRLGRSLLLGRRIKAPWNRSNPDPQPRELRSADADRPGTLP